MNGRNFLHLVGLQAGVINSNADPVGGGLPGAVSFNGSPALGNNYLLDGVDMSFGEINALGDAAAGTGGLGSVINTVSVEGIQEFKATSSAYSAEYGRSTGGVINVTTRSGTNELHGTLFHFFRNDALNANDFFSNRARLAKPVLRHNQYGGNLGGPIVQDKLFFFFNFEGARILRGQAVTGNVPTPLLLSQIPNPAVREAYKTLPSTYSPTANPLVGFHQRNDTRQNKELTTLSRVDYNISARQKLTGRFNYNDQHHRRPLIWPNVYFPYPSVFRNLGLQHTFSVSPTKLNELRFGYNHSDLDRLVSDFKNGKGKVIVPGLSPNGREDRVRYDSSTYTLADNFSWFRSRHSLKTGFEIRKTRSFRIIQDTPYVFYNSIADLLSEKVDRVLAYFGIPGGTFPNWNTGLYFQDDFKINNRVQLNMGLRYEYYTRLKGPLNVVADPFGPFATLGDPISEADKNNFGPRLGLVVDLTGKGKTILRAGGGILYIPFQPQFYWDMSFLPAGLPTSSEFRKSDLPPGAPFSFPFPMEFQDSILKAAASGDLSKLPPGLVLPRALADRHRRDEYTEQWNLSLQQALTDSLVIQGSYVGSRGVKLYTSRWINLVHPQTRRRPVPSIGQISFKENGASSNYHAFQLTLNQRLNHGLSVDSYYTWSKTLQYHNSDGALNQDNVTQDFNNIRGSYGPKVNLDTRHRFVLVPSYQFPTPSFAKQSGLGRTVLGGWTIQSIVNARSGYPLNVVIGRDVIGNGRAGGQRPDAVPGVDPRVKGADRLLWFTRAAFDVTAPTREKRFGNLGYNTLRGPSAFWWDLALHKTFSLSERQQLQFRCEIFNWLNHVVLSQPSTNLADVNFGRVTLGSTARSFQFALKYSF